ncbi:hypothetical protein [Methylosinus sporium]|uniref:Uncharacterized protein n=1 Tax=Methylosinus sporium TaxID=428 RepID=A0A2U1SSR7_METSR|nr:hypothetical protein [Methylosinus sporium]PWB94642.1 hypothetical protein C5689_06155 [Methylosinus sporium]
MPVLAADLAAVVGELDALLERELPDNLRRAIERARRSAADARDMAFLEERPGPMETGLGGDVRDMGGVT